LAAQRSRRAILRSVVHSTLSDSFNAETYSSVCFSLGKKNLVVLDAHIADCYAYAFGLSKHPDFASLVYRTQNGRPHLWQNNSRERALLKSTHPSSPDTIALYFDGGPTHAALVREATPLLV
jgi:hypothetical protein